MSVSVLGARWLHAGRVGQFARYICLKRTTNAYRRIGCVYLSQSTKIGAVQNVYFTKEKSTIGLNTSPFLRYLSGDRNSKSSAKRQSLIKRGLVFLAAFLLIHFLVIYVRYKNKRKGGKSHNAPPFAVETIDDPELKRKFSVINGYLLPDFVSAKTYDDIFNFRVHPDDIYVVSFPKSGTTWVQEIVYLIKNNCDTEKAKCIIMEDRFPYLEYIYPGVKEISKKLGGRLIKSHLPLSLLPEGIMYRKAKVIYIARNPKDTSVSYYHYARMLNEFKYKRPFNDFIERFLRGDVPYGPWWNHNLEFWINRDQENILFICYEDLQRDMKSAIRKIAEFLGRKLSDEQVDKIADHCTFKSMQSNPAANYSWWDSLGLRDKNETHFLRKGKIGDWHNYYNNELDERMDQICKEKFKDHKLFFIYDI